jgi:hypothetical protein
MHVLRKTIVLGFAGLGVYKAWELANENLDIVRERAGRARKRLEPALAEAEDNVKAAVDTVTDAVSDVASDTEPTQGTIHAIHSVSHTA